MAKLITMKQKENEQYVNLYPQTDWSQVNGADAQIASVNNSVDVKVANLQGQINQKQDANTAVNQGNLINYIAISTGYYTGNGEENRTIILPFTPTGVFVTDSLGITFPGYPTYSPRNLSWYGGLAVTGKAPEAKDSEYNAGPIVEVTTNGFIVHNKVNGNPSGSYGSVSAASNISGNIYIYMAVK